MGSWFSFRCANCGYAGPQLCGSLQYGGQGAMRTIHCMGCMKLYDVPSWRVNAKQELPLHCPKVKGHLIRIWNDPGPCPKCGTILSNEGETGLWDQGPCFRRPSFGHASRFTPLRT